jgi:formylglycine-generating enzyme required for sulfatase activity
MCQRGWIAVVVLGLFAVLARGAEGGGEATPSPAVGADPTAGIELVHVHGGCFKMGDIFGDGEPEESPVHEVCVGDFDIGKYEVTQGQWKQLMESNPSRDAACRDDRCPVENVSWNEVQEFIRRLNARTGGAMWRLPTEAEWEYAARSAGKRERYSGGNDVDGVAWFAENSGRRNHPVGGKAPNGLGLHDMSGNVWEWTADWYADDYYSKSPRDNPTGPERPVGPNVDRVIRGGCKTGEAHNARTSRRSFGYRRSSSDRSDKIGFRVIRAQ